MVFIGGGSGDAGGLIKRALTKKRSLFVFSTKICNICYTHFKKKYNYKLLINYIEDRLGHDQRYAINPDLIEKKINWSSKFDFEETIENTFYWYLKNKTWWKNLIK